MKRARGAPGGRAAARTLPVLLAVGALVLASCASPRAMTQTTSPTPPPPTNPYAAYATTAKRALRHAFASVHVALPAHPREPAPALPANAFGTGLGSHTVLGFLPSWEIDDLSGVDWSALSEVAYYAVQVEPQGTILESGQGWETLTDGSVAGLVSDAHEEGVRALLTVYTGTEATLKELTSHPFNAGEALAARVARLLAAYDFDGVDIDLEGDRGSERAGFVKLVRFFSERLRAIDPAWTIVLDTVPESAVDSTGFYDVKALVPFVSQLFIMAYDMSNLDAPGPTAPLEGAELSDVNSLASYVAAVPRRKLLLGIPFYGYAFEATGPFSPAETLGTPDAVTYDSIVASGRRALWDPASETPYLSFRLGRRWRQTWFDDPTSVALKVALASTFGTDGVGAWDIGMVTGQPEMTNALDGGSPPRRLPLARQP